MRLWSSRSTLAQRIAQHIQRGEPISLASVPAATITRVLLDGPSQPGGRQLLCLRAAHITGALNLRHASLSFPLVFESCTFDEPVTVEDGHLRVLEFRSCTLPAFEGQALRVAGDLTLIDTRVGRIDLFSARVGGQLWLNNSHVDCGEIGWAVSAPQIGIAGGCYANGLTVRGGLNLWGADIQAGLELGRAILFAEDRPALRAPNLSVTGDVTLGDGATISGAVNLSSVKIGGCLTLNYRVTGEHKIIISNSDIKTLHLEVSPPEHVTVDLTGCVVTSFLDTPRSWPKMLKLDRTRYETLRPLLPARERLAWLKRNEDSNSPQPYEQLARQYREAGQDYDARTILLAKHRNRTRHLRFPAKLWGYLQDVTIGYGYRPVRAMAWLAGLTMIVAVSSTVWQPRPVTGAAPDFNFAAYALDVVLPILDLGQEKSYSAVGFGRGLVWIAIIAGWLLASTIITAVTRNISRS
ncbi:hypothetical protein [Actinophytocola sp.]|uniref:hypothetical protein n=1 Tax=Actinophytocola sp. TaxID=1872138 RepID=UPI00389A19BA